MENHFDFKRRNLLKIGLATPLILISACVSTQKPPLTKQAGPVEPKEAVPIKVDVSKVKDVPSLIAAIRKAGAHVLPKDIPDEVFYKEFATKFVENAKSAVKRGYKIPDWILDKLPLEEKVFIPPFGMVAFTLAGALFVLPLDVIFIAVLGSIILMSTLIDDAIDDVKHKKYRPRI
jgi:hypothetical protein